MLDMISMLTLLNSGKEEEEEGEATKYPETFVHRQQSEQL